MKHPPTGQANREDFLLRVLAESIREYLAARDSFQLKHAEELLRNVRSNLQIFDRESTMPPPDDSAPEPTKIKELVEAYLGECPVCSSKIGSQEEASCDCKQRNNDGT